MLRRGACVRVAAGANHTSSSTTPSAPVSDPFASPGWPEARSHRTRSPAQQVAPGVGSSSGRPVSNRRQRRQATTARELLRRRSASNSAARPTAPRPQHTWREFYAQREAAAAAAAAAAAGDEEAEAVTGRQQAAVGGTTARRLLFSAPAGDAAAAARSGTRALRGKLVPALRTTQQWTRVQRKLLPRYLHVLDAVTAPLLLKTLVRLQPPRPRVPDRSEEALPGGAAPASLAANKQQEQQQQLLPVAGVSSSLLLQLTTSNSGSLRVRGAAAMQQRTTTLGAATPRGFADAASERREFECMLLVVYDALRHKLATWPGGVLTQLLGASGQLLVVHHGFVQALLAASGGQLAEQPMPQLVGCLEALARLQVLPPEAWRMQWVDATQDRLGQLSLPQLAALQLHTAGLQLPLPGAWWQQFGAAVLQHAARATTINSRQLVSVADALSSLLCAAAIAPPPAPPPTQQQPGAGSSSWHAPCLQVCLVACQQGRLSTSGVVQLLAACSLPGGSCTRLPDAQAARSAALQLLCQRMSKLPCPAGVELLLGSLQALGAAHVADPLPPDLRSALEARLVEVLPQLPARVLLQVPSALAAAGAAAGSAGSPAGDRLLAAFALVSQAQLGRLSATQLVGLLRACAAAGFDMPTLWCRAAGQRLAAAAAAEEELVGGPAAPSSEEAWQQHQQLAARLIAGSGWQAAALGGGGGEV